MNHSFAATSQGQILSRLGEQFDRQFGDTTGVHYALAPGRVNLIGDHTDYNDGFVLPMSIDRAVYWALRRRHDHTVRLYSANFEQAIEYPLNQMPHSQQTNWSSYVSGVIEELRLRNLLDCGLEGVVWGNVPLGGGLSSSAALEVSTAVALQSVFGFELEAVQTAKLCQQVEQQYAGVNCGIMDQFACRLGRRGHALFLDCRSLEYRNIPLKLDGSSVMIVDTGVKRELAVSSYNERRAECEQGLTLLGSPDAATALRDISPALLRQQQHTLPELIGKRCQHVISENQRVLDAANLLECNQLAGLGTLMNESHASLRDYYEVSCAELDTLVDIGQQSKGVLGARMTGAGFGGCAVFLLETDAIAGFEQAIRTRYSSLYNHKLEVIVLGQNLEAGTLN